MTICWTILSSSSQYWTVLPLLLSGREEGKRLGEAAGTWLPPGQGTWAVRCKFLAPPVLTRHLETVVQDGHKVRVGLCVSQPLPRQLKHLSCAFGVYVNLRNRAQRAQATGLM